MAAAEAFWTPPPDKQMVDLYGGDIADYMPEILVNSAIIESYNIFADLETQWVASPSGGVLGINYAAIPLVLKVHDVKDHTQAFRDIRIMEAAARTAINNRESA